MDNVVVRVRDAMQVCRNGHVITDLLRSRAERSLSHCDRCGATTIDRCLTCGCELPGALAVPGLQPIGSRLPPRYCCTCGAAFPWTERPHHPETNALAVLETMLRRLPRVIRELRTRHGDRSPFRVEDERDLEDLLRALLPLQFEDVRPECRTPSYSAGTRTDFLLPTEEIAVTIKIAQPWIAEQLREDVAYYLRERKGRILVGYIYDPELSIREPHSLLPPGTEELDVRCVLGTP
jgi:hypothetical protein